MACEMKFPKITKKQDDEEGQPLTQYAALPWRLGEGVEILLATSRDTRRWIIPVMKRNKFKMIRRSQREYYAPRRGRALLLRLFTGREACFVQGRRYGGELIPRVIAVERNGISLCGNALIC
jgi:hypothetical protein